jgi:short-subunit dehydrogenase
MEVFAMNILITGAASGIGFETAKRLAFYEHNVIIGIHTNSQLNSIEEKIKNYKNIKAIKIDVTKNKDLNMLENIKIDVLICNAGVGYGGSILDIPMYKIKKNYEINVFSVIKLIQLVSKQMIERGSGRIIIMSSLLGMIPMKFLGIYSSTKASLNSIAYNLNKEFKEINKNIKVSLIQPGAYYTGFNQRMVEEYYNYKNDSNFSVNKITKKNLKLFSLIEKKSLNSIVSKILDAVLSENPRFIYRAPFSQSVFIRLQSMYYKLNI